MPTFVPSQQAASPRRNARLLHHPTVRVAMKGLPPSGTTGSGGAPDGCSSARPYWYPSCFCS
jgi:hypothetical protein